MKREIGLLVIWLWWPLAMLAQTMADDETYFSAYELDFRVLQFQEELNELHLRSTQRLNIDFDDPMSEGFLQSLSANITTMEESMQSYAARWDTFMNVAQNHIAMDDSLLNKVGEVQAFQQTVNQSIVNLRQQFDQIVAFNRAEAFVFGQDSVYSSLYKKARALTLSAKMQAQLEKVKAAEQLVFADVQKHYDEAKQTIESFPQLQLRMERLENKYIELKVVSGKIQEAAFKPFLERVKDWLISLAAVAIVLMFANLVITRIKTAQKAMAMAKKMKNMMGGGMQDYPTI
jgi:hypothetical protein